VRSCWFEGGRNPILVVTSEDALIIGNRFIGGEHLDVFAGHFTWAQVEASGPSDGPRIAATNCRIIGNVLDTGQIRVGSYWSSGASTIRAQNNHLAANIRNGAAATTNNGISLVLRERHHGQRNDHRALHAGGEAHDGRRRAGRAGSPVQLGMTERRR
jgi:hypothetical protein